MDVKTDTGSSNAKRLLNKYESEALIMLQNQSARELELCQTLTGCNVLTTQEYEFAAEEFKELIETPHSNGEPIYIMPEFDVTGCVHPKIAVFVSHIQSGTPYDQFVTETYGVTWPIVLRLFYGLRSGFKISIEQMDSMLKVSYWRATGLKLEMVPIFNKAGQINGFEVDAFISNIPHLPNNAAFIQSLARSDIPKSEKSILKITLNHDYVNFARGHNNAEYLNIFAKMTGVPDYSQKYVNKIEQQGAMIFKNLIYSGQWPHNAMIMGSECFLILPSQTLFKFYLNTLHPTRGLQYKRRLGLITASMMEFYADRNMRVGNLFAPGVTGPQIVHAKVSLPVFIYEHDNYHCYHEGTLSPVFRAQMHRAKQVLRSVLPDGNILTSEIMRSIELERSPHLAETERFFQLLEYIFAVDANADQPMIRHSAVILLIDMLLHPQHWPYFSQMKPRVMHLLWPFTEKPALRDFEQTLAKYAVKFSNQPAIISILMLCHYYLKDANFAQSLAENFRHGTQINWIKNADKCMQPVLIRDQTYTLDTIATWSHEQRLSVLAPSKYCVERRPNCDDKEVILANGGKICNEQSDCITFFMPRDKLIQSLRQKLGCDRVRSAYLKSEQIMFLQKSIPSITIESEPKGGAFCTYPVRYRSLVEQVLLHWDEIVRNQCSMTIQKLARGYLVRLGLFKDIQAREVRITDLKKKAKTCIDTERYTEAVGFVQDLEHESKMVNTTRSVLRR